MRPGSGGVTAFPTSIFFTETDGVLEIFALRVPFSFKNLISKKKEGGDLTENCDFDEKPCSHGTKT